MNAPMRRRNLRGFMLIEMLAAMILLTAFALVATRLFTWSMRVTAEAPQAEARILLFDSMLEQLRTDAWPSAGIRVIDERNLDMGDGAVQWAVRDDGSVSRTTNADTRTWLEIGNRVRFESDDGGVTVRVLDARGAPADRITVPSEVQLLRKAAR